MSDDILLELTNKLELRKRYRLKGMHRGQVPTNNGMKEGVHISIVHSTIGMKEMELPIYMSLEKPYQPISRSYLESGGIVIESLVDFEFNIIDR